MSSQGGGPQQTHQALTAAIERVAEAARAATPGPWVAYKAQSYIGVREYGAPTHAGRVSMSSNRNQAADAAHIALHDPATVLARTSRDRARAERHRQVGAYCGDGHFRWPCPDYRDLLLDYGIEVP